jgi:hypothetical protein
MRISFRNLLREEIARFLDKHGMTCAATADAMVELVVALGHYHEEGVALFPQVFICDDLDRVLAVLQGQDALIVGEGARMAATMQDALKRCAPLAQGGWAIFINRPEERFRYGVFRMSAQPLALTPIEGIASSRDADLHVIAAVQAAESVIHLIGGVDRLEIHMTGENIEEHARLEDPLSVLASAATSDLGGDQRMDSTRYLQNALSRILQRSHGTLIAVVRELPSGRSPLSNHLQFSPPIDMAKRVFDYKATRGVEELGALNGAATLLSGALNSDGVTILTSDAKLVAYRAFLPLPAGQAALPGGARRWAFETLCGGAVPEVISAFYQSQDGRRDCRRR